LIECLPTMSGESPAAEAKKETVSAVDTTKELFKAKAIAEYNAEGDDKLSFKKGEILSVLKDDNDKGWWLATIDGEMGYVPSKFFRKYRGGDESIRRSARKAAGELENDISPVAGAGADAGAAAAAAAAAAAPPPPPPPPAAASAAVAPDAALVTDFDVGDSPSAKPVPDDVKNMRSMVLEFLQGKCHVSPNQLRQVLSVLEMSNSDWFSTRPEYDRTNDLDGWFYVPYKNRVEHGDWEYSYHGTNAPSVPSILLNGSLVLPGETTRQGVTVQTRLGHIKNRKFIFTTPSLFYASHDAYAWPSEFTYKGEKFYMRTVVQVKLRKGSFTREKITVAENLWDRSLPLDERWPNDLIECVIDDPQFVSLEAVLFHASRIPIRDYVKQEEQRRRDKNRY